MYTSKAQTKDKIFVRDIWEQGGEYQKDVNNKRKEGTTEETYKYP